MITQSVLIWSKLCLLGLQRYKYPSWEGAVKNPKILGQLAQGH